MITKEEVMQAQQAWGDSLVEIGKLYIEGKDYHSAAVEMVDKLYGYDERTVLFKPTKASELPFRLTKEGAVSYFVRGNDDFPEDLGFALQPITEVHFKNAAIDISEYEAVSMGHYFFTNLAGDHLKVEFTMVFYRAVDKTLKLWLHHSSFPFVP
jgi:hypothetical protein